MDIRGGGDGMLQVEEENKLKRKWSQAFMTENDKEEDEFDINRYPKQINFMRWINMYINLPLDLNILY